MPRWLMLLLLPMAACASDPVPEAGLVQRANPEVHAAPAPPRAPSAAGSGLVGATPEALRATLGEPLLRRTEGPAQIWLYAGAGCQLDIVLYAGEAGARVAHVQARAGGIAQRSAASCLRDISAQAARPDSRPAGPTPPIAPGMGDEVDV
ncbi:MAG: hypothetical protein K5Q68_01835 [Roseococcus sp.]|nr:hypothetical protein [Roseococcus sp.]